MKTKNKDFARAVQQYAKVWNATVGNVVLSEESIYEVVDDADKVDSLIDQLIRDAEQVERNARRFAEELSGGYHSMSNPARYHSTISDLVTNEALLQTAIDTLKRTIKRCWGTAAREAIFAAATDAAKLRAEVAAAAPLASVRP